MKTDHPAVKPRLCAFLLACFAFNSSAQDQRMVQSSHAPGRYAEPIAIELKTGGDVDLRFTTDGADPSSTSSRYSAPIPVKSTTVLKVRPFHDGSPTGPVETTTYIIGATNQLPSISISGDPSAFYGPQGIMDNATQHGREWERPVVMEYFLPNGQREFAVSCGARVHGGFARLKMKKLSLRLYFRSEYGPSKLEYPMFASTRVQQFDKLILRANCNDSVAFFGGWSTAINVKDQTVRELFMQMGNLAPHGNYAAVYLNGKPMGLYNPVERIDEKFLRSHYGKKTSWDVVKGAEWDLVEVRSGDDAAWNALNEWVARADARDSGFLDELRGRVDVDNFLDYWLLNVWHGNQDWPGKNFYAVRNRDDGKWLFLPWDTEFSFGSGFGYSIDRDVVIVASSAGNGPKEKSLIGTLMNKALANAQFLELFWSTYEDLETGVLNAENQEKVLADQLRQVETMVQEELDLWREGRTRDQVGEAEKLAFDFVKARGVILRDQLTRRCSDIQVAQDLRYDPMPEKLQVLLEIIDDSGRSNRFRAECIDILADSFASSQRVEGMMVEMFQKYANSPMGSTAAEAMARHKMSNTSEVFRQFLETNESEGGLGGMLGAIGILGDDQLLPHLDAALRKLDTRTVGNAFRFRVADLVFRSIQSPLSVASAAALLKQEPESKGFEGIDYRASRTLIEVIGELGFSEGRTVLNDIHQDERFPQSIREFAFETAQGLPPGR